MLRVIEKTLDFIFMQIGIFVASLLIGLGVIFALYFTGINLDGVTVTIIATAAFATYVAVSLKNLFASSK